MKRVNDTLVELLDSYTGENVTFNKVTTFADGSPMDDTKCDGVIYRKLGSEYFKICGEVNVKNFGSIGDGTGITPQDLSQDIENEPWNIYPDFAVNGDEYNPFRLSGSWNPPTEKPFSNTDSWDYIGIQRAIWSRQYNNSVYLPKGVYCITKGLLFANHFSGSFFGDGVFATTIIAKEGFTNNLNMLRLYRLGGAPTIFRDMQICPPSGGGMLGLTIILLENTNGARFRSLWIQGAINVGYVGDVNANYGFRFEFGCSDIFVDEITMEYCDTFFYLNGGSDLVIHDSNIWQSAVGVQCRAIEAPIAEIAVYNSRFKGFLGTCVNLSSEEGRSIFHGNTLTEVSASSVAIVKNCSFKDNIIKGSANNALLVVYGDSHIIGNIFHQNALDHPAVDFVFNNGDYARSCIFSLNTINSPGNLFPIGSLIPGVGFTGGLKDSVISLNIINSSPISGVSDVDNILLNNKVI